MQFSGFGVWDTASFKQRGGCPHARPQELERPGFWVWGLGFRVQGLGFRFRGGLSHNTT